MYTLSTRTLSTLAYERGEEYDPSLPPVSPGEIEALALFATARPVIGEPGDYERRRREHSRIPDWFSAEDLIAAPWETGEQRFA